MKVLVIGAEGFIGSHLVESLVSKGHKVTAFVLYNSFNFFGWLENIEKKKFKKIKIITGDIRDFHSTALALKNIDVVINLAALIAIPYSYKASKSYIDTNIIGVHNILEAAKINNTKKIIMTSTSEIYGTAKYVPIDENHPINSQSPYAATKASADQLAISYYRSFNLPVTILRPFNTFGPRQSMRAVIPTIIGQVINNNEVNIGNIKPTRDFTFVTDIAEAFVRTLSAKKISGEIINVGSNFEVSIKEIIDFVATITNRKIIIKKKQERFRPKASEVNRLICSNKKAKKLLKWSPNYNGKEGFKKALIKTIDWFSK
jgi:dTDP-glucose 4,6-dehydratase